MKAYMKTFNALSYFKKWSFHNQAMHGAIKPLRKLLIVNNTAFLDTTAKVGLISVK